MPVFEHEEAGRIEVRQPKWRDFAAWGDQFARETTREDSYQNFWAAVAVSPGPAELPGLIDDFSALPVIMADALVGLCGAPSAGVGGLAARYPVVPDAEVPEDLLKAARKRSRRAFFVRTPAGLWAMRPPNADAASDYRAQTGAWGAGQDGASFAEANRALVLACVLSPEPAAVTAAIEEYPAIPWCLAPELADRNGSGKALVRVS